MSTERKQGYYWVIPKPDYDGHRVGWVVSLYNPSNIDSGFDGHWEIMADGENYWNDIDLQQIGEYIEPPKIL